MDVFNLRNQLVSDYSSFITGFINIRDPRINKKVEEELNAGLLWPDPLIQLNPSFEPGETIDELVEQSIEYITLLEQLGKNSPLLQIKASLQYRHQRLKRKLQQTPHVSKENE